MATDLIMPAPAMAATDPNHASAFYPPPPRPTAITNGDRPHIPGHQRSQSYNSPSYPQISPLSTSQNANTSPTSPKSYHARQLRPMYMPAVLRPTEFPSKLPATTSKCGGSSDGADADEDDHAILRRSNSSLLSLTGLAAFGHRLNRRSTHDSGKCLTGDWDLELFPKVTAEPTKKHWKPDPESSVCDDPTCKRKFNYFTRRHHCRKCGNIFCDYHSGFDIPLDQDANYNPRGSPSRSCSHCFHEFKEWRSRNNSQAGSQSSSDAATNTTPTSPIATGPAGTKKGLGPGVKGPDAAASVPRDWNWSTF